MLISPWVPEFITKNKTKMNKSMKNHCRQPSRKNKIKTVYKLLLFDFLVATVDAPKM